MAEPDEVRQGTILNQLRWGWTTLLVFLVLGIALEAFHGFKSAFYLDVDVSTRRLMWTLAHAHGALMGVLHLGLAFTLREAAGLPEGRCRVVSPLFEGGDRPVAAGLLCRRRRNAGRRPRTRHRCGSGGGGLPARGGPGAGPRPALGRAPLTGIPPAASSRTTGATTTMPTIPRMRTTALLLAFGLGACAPPAPAPGVEAPGAEAGAAEEGRTGVRVLLVGIDGASRSVLDPLLADGGLPFLASLCERGTLGTLESVLPMASPALWTEILTGRPREEHGITFFTLQDEEGRQRMVNSNDRQCLALWNLLTFAERSVGLVGFWATWPAEEVRGYLVSDRIARSRFVEWYSGGREQWLTHPPELIAELSGQVVAPEDLTVEQVAEVVELSGRDAAEYHAAEQPIQGHAFGVLKFGYAAQLSVERIALDLAGRDQPDLAGVFLVATDPISHTFWHFYRPEEFHREATERSERLGQAVPGIYRHNDRYLRSLAERLDPSTVILVVSDHGFRASPGVPPRFSAEEYEELRREALRRDQVAVGQSGRHDPEGVLLAAGGPIVAGGEVNAKLADVVPTVLALLGVGVPEDLPGRVLTEIIDPDFLERHPVRTVPSYEGRVPRVRREVDEGIDETQDLQQLRALGYIR